MKFKDKDGNVLVSIEAAYLVFCTDERVCKDCPLNEGCMSNVACNYWAKENPYEAAALMGYEIIEDDATDTNVACKEADQDAKGMSHKVFETLIEEIRQASLETLIRKNAGYASDGDRLHNFRVGGDIMGGTPAQACWGYLTKHLVALRDKIERNDFSDLEDLKEKCIDTINYTAFLWVIGCEERDKVVFGGVQNDG